jgi:hypothetical protein
MDYAIDFQSVYLDFEYRYSLIQSSALISEVDKRKFLIIIHLLLMRSFY